MHKKCAELASIDAGIVYLIATRHKSLPDAAYITKKEQRDGNHTALKELLEKWTDEEYTLIERMPIDLPQLVEFVNVRYGKKSFVHDLIIDADEVIIFDAI